VMSWSNHAADRRRRYCASDPGRLSPGAQGVSQFGLEHQARSSPLRACLATGYFFINGGFPASLN
jgi:hypothetical protein